MLLHHYQKFRNIIQRDPSDGPLKHGQACYLWLLLHAPVTQVELSTVSEELPLVVERKIIMLNKNWIWYIGYCALNLFSMAGYDASFIILSERGW